MSSQDLSITRRASTGKGSVSHVEEKIQPTLPFVDHIEDPSLIPQSPNRWARYRETWREPMAEALGVCILILFGDGVVCQISTSANPAVSASPKGSFLSLNFAWAVGVAMGVWVSGGISGGHINPAVTLAFATYRGFPWKKVPIYIFAQTFGAFIGAALVYANYFHAIDIVEGGRGVRTLATAGYFSTYAMPYMTNVSCFFSEFLATAVLVLLVFAMTDQKNMPPPNGLIPLYLFIAVLGIGSALGMETGYALNPARDLGPRIFTSMAGYGRAVYTFRNQYWLWCPILAPILGAQAGAFFYDAFLYTSPDSIFNKPNAAVRQGVLHAQAQRQRAVGAEVV